MSIHLWFILSLILSNIVKNCRLSTQVISVIIVLFSPCNCVAAHLLHKCSIRSILKELYVNRQLLAFFLIKLQFSSWLYLSFPAKIFWQNFWLQVIWKNRHFRQLTSFMLLNEFMNIKFMLARMITERKKHWILIYFIFFNTGSLFFLPLWVLNVSSFICCTTSCVSWELGVSWFNCIVLYESQMTKEEWKSWKQV